MAKFEIGDFVLHRSAEKGYGFVIEVEVSDAPTAHYKVWHMVSDQNPRRDIGRFLSPADREPTDEELTAFVAWRLTC